MSIVAHRSVIALTEQARHGLAGRTLIRMVIAVLFVAGFAGWRTAASRDSRAAAAAQQSHPVTGR
jgi:hypothetical protein